MHIIKAISLNSNICIHVNNIICYDTTSVENDIVLSCTVIRTVMSISPRKKNLWLSVYSVLLVNKSMIGDDVLIKVLYF